MNFTEQIEILINELEFIEISKNNYVNTHYSISVNRFKDGAIGTLIMDNYHQINKQTDNYVQYLHNTSMNSESIFDSLCVFFKQDIRKIKIKRL